MAPELSCLEFPYATPLHRGSSSRLCPIQIEGFSKTDYITRLIKDQGCFYEIDLLEHLVSKLNHRGLAIDVGANIGNHTIYFAKFLASHVLAIEPNSDVIPILERNLERNKLLNVSVIQRGAGSSYATRAAVLPKDAHDNVGRMQLLDLRECDDYQVPVQVQPLDDMVATLSNSIKQLPVSLIKIDVEGMQMEVLIGAQVTIQQHRPDIVVEAPTLIELAEVNTFLSRFGYKILGKFCKTPTYHFRSL